MDSESGRVKGSIKDRLISFLYRKRFKIKLLKNKLIKRETKIQLIYHQRPEIKNYRDIKKMGRNVLEVDLQKEKFDFNKYDYYVIEPVKKRGIDTNEIEKIENKKNIVNNSLNILNQTKKDLDIISINMKYPHSHQQSVKKIIDNINSSIQSLKEEVTKLGLDIDIKKLDARVENNQKSIDDTKKLVNYYENKLGQKKKNLEVVKKINSVKFKKNIGILNSKTETNPAIKKFNDSEIEKVRLKKVNKNIKNKKINSKKTVKILNKFDGAKIRQLKNNEEKIKNDVSKAKDIVNKMNSEVTRVTKEIKEVTKLTGYSRIIKSCFSLATGILTLPFTGLNIFNITLGSALINKGLTELRHGLERKSEIKVDYKYEDLTNKIKETKDKTKLTELLIMDSLAQIKSIKKYTYLGQRNIDILNLLEQNLNKKLNEIDNINNKLNRQDKINKQKIRKIENNEY